MEVVQADAQAVAALEVVDEVVVGLVGFRLVGLREVDEVRAVREDVQARGVAVVFGRGVESVAGRRVEWRGGPFALGLEEEGEGVGADLGCIVDGVLDACIGSVQKRSNVGSVERS